jgi:uncharacterized protein YtpQ (UPF0354 family)
MTLLLRPACVQVSALLSNELVSLRSQRGVDAVHVLATRVLQKLEEQDAGEFSVPSLTRDA